MITDYKQLVAIFKNNVASLPHRLQRIIYRIHQSDIRILFKLWPQLFIAEWLPRHKHKTNRQEETPGMYIMIHAIVIHEYTRLHDSR